MEKTNPFQELMHVLVLIALLLVLLVVATKFKVIHPSQVPGWQGVYCDYIEQKHSRVAFVYGQDGLGGPQGLVDDLSKSRPKLRVDLLRIDEISPDLLSQYEVVVLEKSRTVSFKSVSSLQQYLDRGGSMVWTADALSNQTLDSLDVEEARRKNSTLPKWREQYGKDYYEWFLEYASNQQGFGEFGEYFVGGFLKTQSTTGAFFRPVLKEHLLLAGISNPIEFQPGTELAVVNQNPEVTILASYDYGGTTYPAILERKYTGKILYLAFPIEALNSPSFTDNIFDYLITCS